MRQLINAFNTGEFTEELLGRVDLESLRKACRLCRNFIPRTLGGVRRRPGLMRLGAAKYPDKKCRLLPFNFSTEARFMMEAGEGYLRFWRDGAPLLDGDGDRIELAAPWTEAQLFSIQMTQVNDLVYFVHPEFPVQELRRVTDISWTLAEFAWAWPAMRDENPDPTTMACSVTTGSGTLTSSAPQFTAGDVGAYYEITHNRPSSSVGIFLVAGTTSAELKVLGTWEVSTTGIWAGDLYLEIKQLNGDWTVLRSWVVSADKNIQASGVIQKETWMRLRFVYGSSSGTVDPRAQLEALDPEIRGLVRVTGYTSPTVASVTVIRDLWSTSATLLWSEGAWSARRGFPRSVAIHQQRLVFGGCAAEPQKIWGSAIGDFNNFKILDLDDSGYAVLIAAQEANPIVWLASQDGLIIGTEGDEWLMDSGDEVISPSNPPYSKRKTKFGSADLQAQLVGSVVIFVQRGRRSVREYVFAFDEQGYKAPDLSQLSEHMTQGGVVQLAYAQNPDSTIWAVTGDEKLLSCTYRRESEVVAWAQHPSAGAFESVATIYGAENSGADEVWMSVRRTIDGVESRHIERFDPEHWILQAAGEPARARMVHFDCSLRIHLDAPASIVTGLEHLEGAVVAVRVDGASQQSRKVSEGFIVLDSPGTEIVAGLPYMSILQPFLFDTVLQDGTSQGSMNRTPEIRARLQLAGAMQTADSAEGPFRDLSFRSPMNHPMDAPPPLFSGLTDPVLFQANFTDGTNFTIRTDSGEPLNILMVVAQTGIYVR